MKYNTWMISRYQRVMQPVKCTAVFLAIGVPVFMLIVLCRSFSSYLFQAGLLLFGWSSWTFFEYMLHRFGHHGHKGEKMSPSQKLHHYHHTHPREIRVTGQQRVLLVFISLGCLWLSLYWANYFTLLCGWVWGITTFFLMHFILHQKWSAKIFPRLHRFHINHHCKYPGLCHGISVPWWDLLFKTIPPREKAISDKITHFYYTR